jgi:NAD(P)-dependent dehydrogenase (short-subunit alcohol dehydrogenase family)
VERRGPEASGRLVGADWLAIAGSVFLLAADEAAWITGQTIMANAGNAFGL